MLSYFWSSPMCLSTVKSMRKIIKKVFRKFGLESTINFLNRHKGKYVSLKPANEFQGNVLLSYIIDPFLLKKSEHISNAHHHDWLSWQIAQTFLELGYCVDVIHYTDRAFIPRKDYSFFIGARTNFQRIAERLGKDCIKIVHLDTAHWLFNNYSSFSRSLDLQKRKGVTITSKSQRIVESNLAIEYADYATTNLGNQFNISTYRYAQKPIFQIYLPTCSIYHLPEDKDYEACRKNYLWFGSVGFVHKGLDLVLEAFAEMPDYRLYVCGPMHKDKVFEKIYYKELYQTPNIHTIGWVDIDSPKFIEISSNCVGNVFPSCSEGGGASVITSQQLGLIPVVSYESNVEVCDFGVTLKDCSIDEIKKTIRMVSSLPANELELMSRKAWEFANTNNTKERFAEEYRKFATKMIEIRRRKNVDFANDIEKAVTV